MIRTEFYSLRLVFSKSSSKSKNLKYLHAPQNHTYSREVGVEIKLKKRAWSQMKRAGSARKLIRKQWRAFNR